MERHLLHYTEGNEIIERKEIFNIPDIKEEEIEINTEIYEKSNESLCSNENDNSIPFCNISLSKFLDLTPENDSKIVKNKLNTKTAAKKSENNSATQSPSPERKDEKNDLRNANKQTNLLNRYTERQEIEENNLQDANEEVDIEAEIIKRKKYTERYKRYRERKKRVENYELYLANKRKIMAEASKRYREKQKVIKLDIEVENERRQKKAERQKRYRERKKLENSELNLDDKLTEKTETSKCYREIGKVDVEVEIERRKKNADKNRLFRARKKMKIIESPDTEVAINERKKNAERQRRYYAERKKSEKYQSFLANKRKKNAEKLERRREREKIKKDDLQDVNEVDIEVAIIKPEINIDEQNQ